VFGEHTQEFLHFCDAAASTADLNNKLMVNEFVHTILPGAGELPGAHWYHRLSSASVAALAQHNNSVVRLALCAFAHPAEKKP
jgi:hypothetical protein